MKKIKNLFLAVLVLIVSVFTVNVSANEANGKITIKNAEAGRTYDIYKIFDLTYSGTNKENVAYTVDGDWVGFFFGENATGADYIVTENSGSLNSITYNGVKYYINITEQNVVEFARLALEYARTQSVDVTTSQTPTTNGDIVFNNLPHGYYLIYPVGATEKNDANGSIASLDSTVNELEIELKAGYPTLEKDIEGDLHTYDVGQIANFIITGKVPDTNGFATYTYKISDTWTTGLSLVNGAAVDFKVTINGREIKVNDLTSRESAILTYTENGFTLDIPVMLYQSQVGKEIKVTYGLEVTKDAIMSTDTYNEAKLIYSNNPKDDTKKETVPSREYVYSSQIKVTKVDGKDTSILLAGAKFILKKGNLFYAVDETTGKVTWVTTQDKATEYTTGADGIVTFKGLADGTYSLIETAAPEGYNLLTEAETVTITGGKDATDQHVIPVEQPAQVKNFSGTQLPSTGGLGTKLFIVIGSLLAMISGVVLVTNKRIAKEEI